VIAAVALLGFAFLRVRGRGFLAERRLLREERKLEQERTTRMPSAPDHAKVPPAPDAPEPEAEDAAAEDAASLYARSYIEWLDKQ
jgi:hypothetical protein